MSSLTERPRENQNMWNLGFSIFFILVIVGVLYYMWRTYGTFPQTVSIFDTILMSFAAFRVTRLIVYDKITRWFRELFVKKVEFMKEGEAWLKIEAPTHGFTGTVHDLLGCPWCIGFWSALVISFLYFMYPWAWFVIFFLALAGAGSLLQLLSNMFGWQAEKLKQEVHAKIETSKHLVDHTSIGK